MKSPALRLLLLLFSFCLSVQIRAQEKGATPIPQSVPSTRDTPQSTRAVVIGISDYQDKDIPDLRFADRDAEAFANFLRSPAGGSLDGDHLKVLINEQATSGNVGAALYWLVDEVKEGDNVVIYFSGHGDVERKFSRQPGFLLCWDSPPAVYISGGVIELGMLQTVISTLSTDIKAKVTVITDACHAGKLSGSTVGGAQLTNSNLAQQYANEIKILSCQPNEYSIEGEQWGGGRGAFSFNLVNALYGMADANNDLLVNLREVGRYLEDHVAAEVAPVSQNPKVVGDPNERLAVVDDKLLAELRSGKTSQMKMLSPIESRGMEDDVLARVDTTVREMYRLFKQALKDKVFLEPTDACADAYYERLSAEPKLARLQSTMRRNYAAALQDDSQQVLNKWLKTDLSEVHISGKTARDKYRLYPRYLERAAQLLGTSHYMFATLQARKHFFEGFLMCYENRNPDRELGDRAMAQFREALNWQPDMPQVFVQMARVYGYQYRQLDSAEYYARRAMALQPSWVLPYTSLAFLLMRNQYKQYDRARAFLEEATRLDSTDLSIWKEWGNYYIHKGDYTNAEKHILRGISLNPNYPWNYNVLGVIYTNTDRLAEAERAYLKAIQLDSTAQMPHSNLGWIYRQTRSYAEAEQQFLKAVALDSTCSVCLSALGWLYLEMLRYHDGEQQFLKAKAQDSTNLSAYAGLGRLYRYLGRYAEAEQQYIKAISLDSTIARIHLEFGWTFMEQNRYVEAESCFLKALAIDSIMVSAYHGLGRIYKYFRRYSESEQQCLKAISLEPANQYSYAELGLLYLETRNFTDAAQQYLKAIALDSTIASTWNNLGFAYLNTRLYAEAESVLKKAIALDSTFANPCKHLGMVFFKTKRPDEARQNVLKAIALNPNYAGAMLGMSYLLFSEGKTAEALGYVEQAISKGSTYEQLESDEDLAPLRTGAPIEWEALMKKYFADKVYYNLACEQSLKGELDKAFESLDQSLTSGWKDYDWMQQDTDLAPLRARSAQWEALMKKYFPDKVKD